MTVVGSLHEDQVRGLRIYTGSDTIKKSLRQPPIVDFCKFEAVGCPALR